VCKTQKLNIENDKIKNEWAKENGYKLLRFWEHDINNNIKYVTQTLLENLI
jgi:very-short-patch-repair endonuclease